VALSKTFTSIVPIFVGFGVTQITAELRWKSNFSSDQCWTALAQRAV